MEELFEKYEDEYLEFERIENKRSNNRQADQALKEDKEDEPTTKNPNVEIKKVS